MKIDLRTIPDAEVSGIDLMDVDITLPAPEAEPQRQYYFMSFTIPVPSVKTPIFASTAVSDSLANTKRKIRA